MVRLDWQKISMRLLAVLLAFVMWLYVSNVKLIPNPNISKITVCQFRWIVKRLIIATPKVSKKPPKIKVNQAIKFQPLSRHCHQ